MTDANNPEFKKTIFLAIPLGEAVRNVLRASTYRRLRDTRGLRIVILSQASGDAAFRAEFGGPNVFFEALQRHDPGLFERGIEAFRLAMLYQRSSTVRIVARRGHSDRLRLLVPAARAATRLLGEKIVHRLLGWINVELIRSDDFAALFARYRPDLVVVSRVLSFSADYLVLKAAVRNGVPVVALASSWDNFTSKGFFPFGIDRVVVWNRIMKDEAQSLFGFPDQRITIAGIPRFDTFFIRAGFRSRESFMESFGFDPKRPLITYTTGHHQLGRPYEETTPEPKIVQALVESIVQGAIHSRPQLLVRLHPQAKPDDFSQFRSYDFVRIHVPGTNSSFPDRDLSLDENVLLGETMLFSDVVVNVASTITIDAAVFDTPVVCVGIDINGPRPDLESIRRFYQFEHYRKLAECNGYRRADTVDAMIDEINAYLSDRARDRSGRRCIVLQQCAYTDGQSGERVAEAILASVGYTMPVAATLGTANLVAQADTEIGAELAGVEP